MRTAKIGPDPSLACDRFERFPSPTCPFNSGQFFGGKMTQSHDQSLFDKIEKTT